MQPLASSRRQSALAARRWGAALGGAVICFVAGASPIQTALFAADDRLFVVEAQANAADGEAFFESAPVQRIFSSSEILPAASQP